jgi:hypothetical protein
MSSTVRRVAFAACVTLAAVVSAFGAPVAGGATDPDLGGEWHLDALISGSPATTPDSSGKGHDLSATSGLIGVAGHFGGAFDFSHGGTLRTTAQASLEPQRITVMAWVKSSGSPGTSKYVVNQGSNAGCTASSYALESNYGGLVFFVWDGNGFVSKSPDAGTGIWDGQWHAVAGTYDGSTVRLYVDGQEVGSGNAAPPTINYTLGGSTDFTVGTASCSDGYHYPGAIDEVRVYDRTLSASEVAQLQNAPGPEPPELNGGGGTGGGGTGGGSGGGPSGPVARVTTGASGVIRGASWFNGAASLVSGGGPAQDYSWDLNGQGKYTWDCGQTSAMSVAFNHYGTHTIGLQVTDASGRVATVQQQVTVARAVGPLPRVTTFDCENPGANNQPDSAGCVKSFGFGVIDVNSRGGPSDCFQITSRVKSAVLRVQPGFSARVAAKLSRFLDYTAQVGGPVALNGLYLPLPEAVMSTYDSGLQTISARPVAVRIGPFSTDQVNVTRSVAPNAQGVVHLFDVNLSGKVPLLGGLPLGAGVSVDLMKAESLTTLHAKLPLAFTLGDGNPAQGDVTLISDNVNGLRFDGAKLGPIDTFLGPVFVENLGFGFRQSDNSWEGSATVTLPGSPLKLNAAPPPPDLGFGLKQGQFDHAGLDLIFVPPSQPELFPGIAVTHIGGAFGLNPTRFTGTAGISAGQLVSVDGDLFVAFATSAQTYTLPSDPGPQLAPLAGRTLDAFTVAVGGTVSLKIPVLGLKIPMANAYVLYEYPDYVELAGGFKFDVSFLSVDGGVKGFVAPSAGGFNLEGGVKACLHNIKVGPVDLNFVCANVGAIVSSKGIGFCGTVPVPFPVVGVLPVAVGAGYRWGAAFPDLRVFTCDYSDYRESSPHAARAAAAQSVTLAAGRPSAMVRLIGRDRAPDVVITGPDNRQISTAQPPADQNVVVVHDDANHETLIALRRPAAGRWTVAPDPGTTPILSVASAEGLPTLKVSARVIGRGARRTLRYALRGASGRHVTFSERGGHAGRLLGAARGASGSISFAPSAGASELREIVAIVEDHGAPAYSLVVARFRSPAPVRLARPAGLRARRTGAAARLTWRPVRGAARYAITISTSGGRRFLVVTRRPGARVRLTSASARTTISVAALAADGARGPVARVLVPGDGRRRPAAR